MKMKYLMILFSFCCSLAAEASMDRYYKVTYNDKFKTLHFEEKFDCITNEKSEIDLIMPFGVVYNINSLEIKKDGINADASFKKKHEVINIKIKDSANSFVNVHIKYRIIMAVKKPFLLSYNYLYFPLDLLKKPALHISDDLLEINWTADFMLPPGWVLISPEEKKSKAYKTGYVSYTITGKSFTSPVFIAGYESDLLARYREETDNDEYILYGKAWEKKYIFKNSESEKSIMESLHSIKKYIEDYYGISITWNELRYLAMHFVYLCVNFGETVAMNRLHIKALTEEKPPVEYYGIIHEIALQIFLDKINPYRVENDYWIIEGLAHLCAINYFKEKYGLDLNYSNINKFAGFLFGKKNSYYARSTSIFRDLVKYKSVTSVSKNNRMPLVDYNYRARTINNHYSIQVFFHLRNLVGNENFKKFITGYFKSYRDKYFTSENFIDSIKKEFGWDVYKIIFDFMEKYPEVDYKLKRKKDGFYILRSKGDAVLPVEYEITYRDNIKKRKTILIDSAEVKLTDVDENVKNIIIDPDGLIEELREDDNYLKPPFHFSLITPQTVPDSYVMTSNLNLCNFDERLYFGATLSGAWNLKAFNTNSIVRPFLLWIVDAGYGPPIKFNEHDFFTNFHFESSVYPLSIWSPQVYTNHFFNMATAGNTNYEGKIGFQGFFPPVINTEHDIFFFNHSWDIGLDLRFFPSKKKNAIDMGLNAGYRIFIKAWFFTQELTGAINFDFNSIAPQGIDIAGLSNFKFDFDILEIGDLTGILKSFNLFGYYDYTRPRITRFSLISNTQGYFEYIANKLIYAQGILLYDQSRGKLEMDMSFTKMNYVHNSLYILFKFVLYKEPLLDPQVSLGFGIFNDLFFSIAPEVSYPYRGSFTGIIMKLDLFRKSSLMLKVTLLSEVYFFIKQYIPALFFEIKSYL